MLKYWPFQNKYLLIIGSVMLAFVGYTFAFKHTFEAWQLNRQFKEQIAQQNDVIEQPDYVNRKNVNLDKIINLYRADTITFRTEAITTISIIANKYKVRLINVPMQDSNEKAGRINLQRLRFTGNYFSLVKFIQELQVTNGIGVMRSLVLKKTREEEMKEGGDKLLLLDIILEVVAKQ